MNNLLAIGAAPEVATTRAPPASGKSASFEAALADEMEAGATVSAPETAVAADGAADDRPDEDGEQAPAGGNPLPPWLPAPPPVEASLPVAGGTGAASRPAPAPVDLADVLATPGGLLPGAPPSAEFASGADRPLPVASGAAVPVAALPGAAAVPVVAADGTVAPASAGAYGLASSWSGALERGVAGAYAAALAGPLPAPAPDPGASAAVLEMLVPPAAAPAPAVQAPSPAPAPAAALLAPLANPVGAPEWDLQLGDRIGVMVDRGLTSAQLKLSPAHLGPLEIRIRLAEDQAEVWFGTHSHATREALEAAAPRLRDMLGAQGYANVGVSVDLQQQSFRDPRGGARYAPDYAPLVGPPSDEPAPGVGVAGAARPVAGRAGLDAYA
ncbi:MAG: flagellar hook-length control protein FliK [Pseudomonadota bacterium]